MSNDASAVMAEPEAPPAAEAAGEQKPTKKPRRRPTILFPNRAGPSPQLQDREQFCFVMDGRNSTRMRMAAGINKMSVGAFLRQTIAEKLDSMCQPLPQQKQG